MSYVAPCSTVILYKGIRLEKTYQHTIFFESVDDQTYFWDYNTNINTQRLLTLTNSQYTRSSRNSIKIAANVNGLLEANYMRFYNPRPDALHPTSGKWFYAFVDSVEYISETVTEVFYTIDVMQTWFIGNEIQEGFVDREHTNDDTFGKYIVPETQNAPKCVAITEIKPISFKYYPALFVSQYKVDGGTVTPAIDRACNIWSAGKMYTHKTYDGFKKLYELMRAVEGSLITVLMIPAPLIDFVTPPEKIGSDGDVEAYPIYTGQYTEILDELDKLPTEIDGYTPLNKKMFISDFVNYTIYDGRGGVLELAPEYFGYTINGTPAPRCEVRCSVSSDVDIHIMPLYYPNPYGTAPVYSNYTMGLAITSMPTGYFTFDTYETWKQSNSNSFYSGMITNAIGGAFSAAGNAAGSIDASMRSRKLTSGKLVSNAMDAVSPLLNVGFSVANSLAKEADMKARPDGMKGALSGDTYLFGYSEDDYNPNDIGVFLPRATFSGGYVSINNLRAKEFDQFLSKYGYAIKQFKKANIYGSFKYRKHFYFLKTDSATLGGSLPADEEERITSIVDNGIVFWNPNSYALVGDYNTTTFAENVINNTAIRWRYRQSD